MALAFPAARQVDTGRAALGVHELGAGFPVVLLHGFPDLAFSFRHQLPALAEAGFRAIAPDLAGAAPSAGLRAGAAYGLADVADDVLALLDALAIERAALVGHDLGALVAYELAVSHATRVAAVVGLVMPHSSAPPVAPTTLWRAALGERFYRLALMEEGRAEARLERDVDRTLRYFYRSTRDLGPRERRPLDVPGLALLDELEMPEEKWSRPSLLTPEEHARYREAFARIGFQNELAWLRGADRDWERRRGQDERIEAPALLVTAEHAAIVPAANTAGMEELCPALERVHIASAGHFVHQERPDEVNRALIEWLRAKVGGAS